MAPVPGSLLVVKAPGCFGVFNGGDEDADNSSRLNQMASLLFDHCLPT